jgi:hypothetical protein
MGVLYALYNPKPPNRQNGIVKVKSTSIAICIMNHAISREISQASASTVRAHFGCIFKAAADCATEVWCVFYVRILGT